MLTCVRLIYPTLNVAYIKVLLTRMNIKNIKIAKCYNDINWAEAHKELALLQFSVLEAYKNCESINKILEKQNNLIRSFAARALAVRKVTSNKGKLTPGIDHIIYKTKKQKFEVINEIKDLSNYKAQPTRRIYITRKNRKGKLRPLGIPTMYDRIVQTLYYFALVPIAEEKADSRNYGFRLAKSTHDVACYFQLVLGNYTATRRYILNADIENFFPSVNHKWLLDNVIMDKRILKEFLKAGFIDENMFYGTNKGFPQGSPISPLLGNMVLDGLQELCVQNDCLFTRFADDFYAAGKSTGKLKELKPQIAEFLKVRGLQLSEEKTYITDISKGFDALGFNFREYPDKNRIKGTKQGIFLVKPAKKNIVAFKRSLSYLVKQHRKSAPMFTLINKLNEKLRGWAEYYRTVTSQKAFSSISYHLWQILWKAIRKKHRRQPARYLVKKYFTTREGNKWIFRSKDSNNKEEVTLFQIAYVPLKRHRLCLNLNPFDPENYQYYIKRRALGARKSLLLGRVRSLLLKKQKGVCPVCETSLLNDEDVEVHHIRSRKTGGSNETRNLLLIHLDCHKQVTNSKDRHLRAIWHAKKIIKDA